MPETEANPTSEVALREEMCLCGHLAIEHADATGAWERGEQTQGRCLREACECPRFMLMEE